MIMTRGPFALYMMMIGLLPVAVAWALGTRYLKDGFFDEAAQTYEQALELFDHPGIRYNLAVAQINLKQPIEAYRNILAAMRYGDVPIGKEIYEQARNYRALLETQLAHIEIGCEVPGAEVTLDGKKLFIAPGRYRGIVMAGAHQAVATRDGYIPEARRSCWPQGVSTASRWRPGPSRRS